MKVTRMVWAGGKDGDHFSSLTYLHGFFPCCDILGILEWKMKNMLHPVKFPHLGWKHKIQILPSKKFLCGHPFVIFCWESFRFFCC